MPTRETQGQYAVYLLDPGPQSAGLMSLLQEITGGSLAECAGIIQGAPALVTGCGTRSAAEDLVARLREFGAVAVVRPMGSPAPGGGRANPLGQDSPPAVPWALAILGLLQVAVAIWWIADGKQLAGLGGLILGVVVLVASLTSLRRAR